MFDAVLKHIVPIPRADGFASYLFIGPHPDDIEIGCAPTVRRLTNQGKNVSFLIVTDGGAGATDPAADRNKLIQTRKQEACAAAKLLGVNEVTFCALPDGGMYSDKDCMLAIAREVIRQRPEAVFVCDPDVRSECHPDHLKVGRAAKSVALLCGFPLITAQWGVSGAHEIKALFFYYTDRPNSYLGVRDTFSAREAALLQHQSQFSAESMRPVLLYCKLRAIRFGLRRFSGKCDGYRALSPVHMHCFPDASKW